MNLNFKPKTNVAEEDQKLLLDLMDKAVQGDFTPIDVSAFHNPEIAEKYNQVLNAFFISNNTFVMRLNNSMSRIGDSSCVKEMIEQINTQTIAIEDMRNSSQELGESIESIVSSVQTIKDTSHEVLTASTESVSSMEETILIVDESERQILSINEQIVAFQEKTKKINEIVDMVQKIAQKSGMLALNASIEAARAGEAGKGFAVVANQVRDLSANTAQSTAAVIEQVNEINEVIQEIVASVKATTRQLQLGKWLAAQTNPQIKGSSAFRQVVAYHEELHSHACDSWYSKQNGNREEALRHFNLAYDSFQKFVGALKDLRDVIRSTGETAETSTKRNV